MLTLIDTGPLVAFLDRADPWHKFVRKGWNSMRGRFLTTGAVITEVMHFLRPIPEGPRQLLCFIEEGLLLVEENIFQVDSLKRATDLMAQYADTPMDFADATLVVLAEKLEVDCVLTLDERGFRTYRYGRHRPFTLVLQGK